MKFYFLFLILFYVIISVFGQPIQYNHKSILKEIKKVDKAENAEISELSIPDSLKYLIISGKYFTVKSTSENTLTKYVYVGRVYSCRAGGCTSVNNQKINLDAEYFDYFILYDSLGIVNRVKVFNYQATHGQEVTVKGWLKQFAGYNGVRELNVGKNIDAISGATISVHAITTDIQLRTDMMKKLITNIEYFIR